MKQQNLPAPIDGECKIELFAKQGIRKTLHENEWWFSVKDVLEALGAKDGTRYAADLRKSDEGLNARYSEITSTLPFQTTGGKQNVNFINIEGLFRLMQSIPSKKVEPFKKWLARVGFERLEEIRNPERAIKRAITLYRAKGYDDEWIDARIRNKASREIIEREWDQRGMREYIGLLTDAVHVATFAINTRDHKAFKGLKGQPLRDNMTPIELTLTTLGEQATTMIIKNNDPQGLHQHKIAAKTGGGIAGQARKDIEQATGRKVISSQNYLTEHQRLNNAQNPDPEMNKVLDRILGMGEKKTSAPAEKPLKIDGDFDDIMSKIVDSE